VLFSTQDGCWKLADFGSTALATSKKLVTTKYGRGTECYRAPEILGDPGKYNNKSDLFAFGCICFRVLAGRPLFTSDFAVGEFARKKTVIFPDQWPVSDAKTQLFNLGRLTSGLLSIDPDHRPEARATHAHVEEIQKGRQLGPSFGAAQITTSNIGDTFGSCIDCWSHSCKVPQLHNIRTIETYLISVNTAALIGPVNAA
jgi:serine/threonine protein kinase